MVHCLGIVIGGRTSFLQINFQQYLNNILQPTVFSFCGTVGGNFMYDNVHGSTKELRFYHGLFNDQT